VQPDTAAVRHGEELNTANLSAFLGEPVSVEQFPGGHSNLTYFVQTPTKQLVLRRPPFGTIAPKAHDMAREFRLLAAIHPHFPEAPQPFQLCEDPAVLGATFFLMERRHGHILRDAIPAQIPNSAREISDLFTDCLARLHNIPLQNGLEKLGKPEGFVERQVKGWSERWRRAQTSDVPLMEQVIAWLEQHLPVSGPPALVHNDYKLDNVVLQGAAITGVLDWEMTTLGDPLIDLGLALTYWDHAPGSGWFSRAELAAAWARQTGRSLRHLPYHEVLGRFKLAVILQQIYARWLRGQTQDPRFAHLDQRVAALLEEAHSLL
jgi:aminoglycoside phosphotransferase (APT) family kinase protein